MSEYQNPPEIDFDQTERITTRLRDLVHSYPKGLALIKEFLQNADDAGAEDLRVIYDRRHHSGELPNPGMTVALGPALLFFNDQYFTESDFNGIQQIGEGSKGFDAARTGRFGQGFNTCYSVTDHPSLLTGDRIAWFDPHHYALGPGKNARAWKLADVVDAWPAWIQTFAPAAPAYRYARSYSDETLHIPEDTIAPVYYWRPEQGAFPGTVFRLPVRSTELAPRSEILPEAFTDDDFDAILDEIRQVGPALLIFLRSVTSLEIREIDAAGKDTLRYWIHTNNAQQVNEERRKLRQAVQGKPQELLEDWLASDDPLPVVQFDHTFVVSDGEDIKREETWAVTTGLFRGPANVLLKAALEVCRRGDKAIPWAGAAVQRNPIDVAVGRIDRKFACFLPLPLAEETLSTTKPLTIWLHGWFDLNSSRREITSEAGGADGTATHARYEWNRALMEYAVGPAWTLLVQRTLGAASDNPQPYALWPPSLGNHGALGQVLHKGFYRAAAALPMIRGQNAQGYHWCTLQNGVRDLFNQRLWAPLLAEGWTLCNPSLPKSVRDGFNSVGHAVSTVTPATLREDLQGDLSDGDIACPVAEAPRPMLRQRAWIDALTEFCAEGNWKNLWYLPLALLADDRLHTFTACGTVYWVEEEERILLAPLPARMLDREFQKKLTLKKPESHGHEVIRLNLSGLIKCIAEILAHKLPIDQKQWLSAVFKYFKNCPTAEITLNEDELKELKLVPDQSGGWHPMGVINTPLIPVPGQTKDLHQALSHLNIAMLHGPRELIEAIREFREAHPGFIKNLHPTNVADYLQAHVEDPTTLNETALDDHEKVLYPLLDFLASTDWLKKDDKRLPQLRKARILVTVRGESVSADTKNLYLLGGFDPPAGVGAELRILYTKSNDANWKRLFEALGVKTLSTDRFIEEVLLPSFTGATPAQWLVYLTWLRDQYQEIFRELPADKRSLLKQRIIDTAIIPIKGGKLATPKTVYHPQAQEQVELLGDLARFPDIEFKKVRGSIEGAWLDFFDKFELPERPLADDLIAAIRALVEKAKTKDVAAVRKPLRQLIVHINLRWNNDLKKDNYRLINHLSNLAWIPALSKKDRTKYAEYRDWPDRLYKPSELIISKLGHLAASVYPILDELEFSYLSDLGLRTKVSLKEVLDHFNTIRESTTASNQALSQAAIAVYRFFGDVQPSDSWKIKAFSDKPSVYLNGVWHRPDRCFFNVPVKTRWTISLQSAGLGTENIAEKKGLERMGVKSSPDREYWLTVLQELSKEHGDNPLPEEPDRQEARLALRELRSCTTEWLKQQGIIPVLLEDGRLKDARLAFIRDDPRLERLNCLVPLPLIEAGDAADIGQRIEDRSLKKALEDRLRERPQIAEDSALIKISDQLQERLRSGQFSESLQRIAYDYRQALPTDSIARIQKLNLCITKSIAVESFLVVEKQELIVFEQNDAACFFDEDTNCLWLLSKGKSKSADQENIYDQTANTLRKICHPVNQDSLLLMRLLGKESQEMLEYLNQKGIGQLPDTEQKEFKYSGDPEPEGFEVPPWPEDDDQSTVDPQTEPEDESSVDPPEDKTSSTGTDSSSGFDSKANSSQSQSKSTGERKADPKTGESERRTPRKDPGYGEPSPRSKPEETASPPPEPGSATPKPRPDANQSRMRTYVHCRSEEDYNDTEGKSDSEAQEIGDAGEQFVMQHERALGRTVEKMPKNHEGYDLTSQSGAETRYIEVKSTKGAWGLHGVKVTYPQYEAALEKLKDNAAWWLYVVEYAQDPDKTVLHRIPNPFNRITEFRFDDGWRDISVAETAPTGPPAPKVGDRYQLDEGQIVTILEAEPVGKLWRVRIQRSNQSESTMMWNPQWQKL